MKTDNVERHKSAIGLLIMILEVYPLLRMVEGGFRNERLHGVLKRYGFVAQQIDVGRAFVGE